MALFLFRRKAEEKIKELLADHSKEVDDLYQKLRVVTDEKNDLAKGNCDLAAELSATKRKCDAADQQIERLYKTPGLVRPKTEYEQWLSRRTACQLYGDNSEDRCLETLTSYAIVRTFDGERARLIVPKVARCHPETHDPIDLAKFHEYDALFEGLNFYEMEKHGVSVRFLFACCWEDNGILQVRPEPPTKADTIIAEVMLPTPKNADEAKEEQQSTDDLRAMVSKLMENCKASTIGEHGQYYRLELDYLGVEFDAKIDTGYTKEDFYHIHGAWLKNLREQCQKSWTDYFEPEPKSEAKPSTTENASPGDAASAE